MTREEIESLVDSTIIDRLQKNNIFENIMSINEVRNKLLNIVKNIEYEDLKVQRLGGFWQPSNSKLVIEEGLKKDKLQHDHVLIHELLHALTTKSAEYSFENSRYEERWGIQCNYTKADKSWGEYGRGLNEGITEWLAGRILPIDNDKNKNKNKYEYYHGISFFHSGSYPFEQIAIKQLAYLYGEDKIIDAYLNNHDIDIPREQYLEILTNFDYINEKDSHIRKIQQDRSWEELSTHEKMDITDTRKNIADTFKASQEFFLEKCLAEEIDKMSTLEEAEVLKAKLRNLNSLGISIEDNPKANYQEYNFRFIRKYLQIVNKDKAQEQQIKFDQIESYLLGDEVNLAQWHHLIDKIKINFSKIKDSVISYFPQKEAEFIEVDRGKEGKIYIKECEAEIIGEEKICNYQYLTEEEYLQYQAGDKDIKGEVLKGNINLKKFQKDKNYAKAVSERLLSQDRIDDKLINYNGYIGYIDNDLRKCVNPEVQSRLEETEKYIKVRPDGFQKEMYILELPNQEEKEYQKPFSKEQQKSEKDKLRQYKLLTKEEVEFCRQFGTAWSGITIQGNIDLESVIHDEKYKQFLEKHLINKNRLVEKCKKFQGYVGEIRNFGYQFAKVNDISYLAQFSDKGANGEEKKVDRKYTTNSKGELEVQEVSWYIQKREGTGEKDLFGNEIYTYEVISLEEMAKMWENKSYANSSDREKIIIKGSERDVKDLSYHDAIRKVIVEGGYVGNDGKLARNSSEKVVWVPGGVVWEMNGNLYCSLGNPDRTAEQMYSSKKQVFGNIDIQRIKTDPEYKKFVGENVFTRGNLEEIVLYDSINKIEIKEADGELSIGEIGKQELNINPLKVSREKMAAIQK